ncbi:retrovirus-related pol polyprotein from transposon TNT 1-94 [Tanacetum coccineum]|uniref:Retrovirus-related pol polyprotein from transposon TNT 1-94 n=1 Tax=Tanacetum coccineum TaxID=301880 RepID=A0ABQ5A7Z5_9ASTR
MLGCRDRWRWALHESGDFTVKELTKLVEEKILDVNNEGDSTIWNKWVPKKVNIFVWRALKGRLPVREELDKRGIDLDTLLCPSCGDVVESCSHCLVMCNFAMSVWEKIFSWWNIGNVNAFSIEELFSFSGNANIPNRSSRLWQAVLFNRYVGLGFCGLVPVGLSVRLANLCCFLGVWMEVWPAFLAVDVDCTGDVCIWIQTYVKSKDLDLLHVITNGDFQPIEKNRETKLDEVVLFEKQSDDLKKRLAKNNEAEMVIYNALPRKEYERIFMCKMTKEIWKTLLITHQGNSQVKDNKIDLLVQQYEQFFISEDESIDSAFARFNTIITSLKALDEGYSNMNYVRKFLRALHPKWRAKVMTIKESKDLTSLSLVELISNLKVHEMIIKKDSEIVKAKGERKSITLKAKTEYSDDACLTFGSEDEEYAMAVRDFKKFFKRRECPKPPKAKNQRAFVRGSWSDSGEDNEKAKDETCLVAQASNEICLGVDLELNVWIKDSGYSKHMTGQICDNKCRVTFSEHDSEITKDGKVIGKGIRKKGLYVMKLGNKPKDKICLATIDENSMLWHRRLGDANMRLIQSLASKELVRNLPKLKFDQHFCDACKTRKQAHASHKAKNIVSTTRCLELLHMDLFDPSAVRSYGGNLYTLVIVDDYSRLVLHALLILLLSLCLVFIASLPLLCSFVFDQYANTLALFEKLTKSEFAEHLSAVQLMMTLEGFPFIIVNTKEYHSECSGKYHNDICVGLLITACELDDVQQVFVSLTSSLQFYSPRELYPPEGLFAYRVRHPALIASENAVSSKPDLLDTESHVNGTFRCSEEWMFDASMPSSLN